MMGVFYKQHAFSLLSKEYLYCLHLISAEKLKNASSDEDQLYVRLHTQTDGEVVHNRRRK